MITSLLFNLSSFSHRLLIFLSSLNIASIVRAIKVVVENENFVSFLSFKGLRLKRKTLILEVNYLD